MDKEIHALQGTVIEPLERYLLDSGINEIMVNETGTVVVEQENSLFFTDLRLNEKQIELIIRLVANSNGLIINTKNPSCSAELLPYRFRFQGIIPPASKRPVFCIRKKQKYDSTLETLYELGSFTQEQLAFLRKSLNEKKNILVAGNTGSGKTSLVNALLTDKRIESERTIIIEDTPELYVNPTRGFRLVIRPGYTYTQALRDVLRMRPDRIIIGELRDSAALDLLKAWNTGHGGGMSTIHANSATIALERLAQLAEERVGRVSRSFIADVVDICVYMCRVGKKRKISEIKNVIRYSDNAFVTREAI